MEQGPETPDENCLKACELVRQITPVEIRILTDHANRRMSYFHLLSSFDGEDFAQEALLRVWAAAQGQAGRRVSAEHVKSMADFLIFLKSTINSILDAERRKGFSQAKFDQVATHTVAEADESSFRDIFAELFAGLEKAAPHLQPLITQWKETAEWTDSIPLLGMHRRLRAELRTIARKRLKEIAPELIAAHLSKKP